MPELPEVETVVKTLETLILNEIIEDVVIHTPSIVYHNDSFKSLVMHQKIHHLSRIGKYILIGFKETTLIVHLRMEGRFFINDEMIRPNKHVHVSFLLSDGRVLHYQDTRKFGRMNVVNDVNAHLSHLGLEYDDPAFTPAYLYQHMSKSHRSIKSFLLSQGVITGLGNIYVDEVCFRSQLHPNTPTHTLSFKDIELIHSMIKQVLSEAISLGGSSIRSYTNAMGIDGRFQLQLKVHMRQGQPCVTCGQLIIKMIVANRGTYVCTHCQKALKLD